MRLQSDDFDSVGELYTEDDFRQLVVSIEATPAFLGGLGKLKAHGERGLVGKTSLGAHGAVADGRERAFNGICRTPGKCPWRTSRCRPSSVRLSAWRLSKAATSASTARERSARAPCAKLRSADRRMSLAGRVGKYYHRSRGITPSVEKWRLRTPHDTPPYPSRPPPTFAHSSSARTARRYTEITQSTVRFRYD